MTIYDTCYFLYKVNFTYYNSDTNDLCMKKNQTEVDLPTRNADFVLKYLTLFIAQSCWYDCVTGVLNFSWQ